MKRSIIFLSLIFVLSGCDVALERLQSGTLEGYLKCVSNNEDKADAISSRYVNNACAKKHSKTRDSSRGFPTGCKASIQTVFNTKLEINNCKNNTTKIITSIKGVVWISNYQNLEDIRIVTERKEIFAEPNSRINLDLKFKLIEGLVFDEAIPFCDDDTEEVCKSWSIDEYSYIDADI